MSGVDIDDGAGGSVVLSEEGGGEAAAVAAIGAAEAVQAGDEDGQFAGRAGEGMEAATETGHEEAGGDAFAGDVGYNEQDCGAGARAGHGENIVVVARNGVGGPGGEGNVEAAEVGRAVGDEPALDVASHLKVAFQGHAVGDFEGQQDQQAERGEKELAAGIVIGRIAEGVAGTEEQQEGQDQDHSPCRGEAKKHSPRKRPHTTPAALFAGAGRKLGGRRLKAEAGFPPKIEPQVAEGMALGEVVPETGQASHCCTSHSRRRRGHRNSAGSRLRPPAWAVLSVEREWRSVNAGIESGVRAASLPAGCVLGPACAPLPAPVRLP